MSELNFYQGDNTPFQGSLPNPAVERPDTGAEHYIASPGLRDAVNVALALGKPLLLTGEPGTGKTQLAYALAHVFKDQLNGGVLKFNTKTTSVARDLFYQYDSLAHFRDAQLGSGAKDISAYINFHALGLAILRSQAPETANPLLPEHLHISQPMRSIVLIDEVDKAPRDLPNDLLHELEHMSFFVREMQNREFKVGDPAFRPFVILSSNSEKNLPEAFLRRCVFYHISFPDKSTLESILSRRMGDRLSNISDSLRDKILNHFLHIRQEKMRKKPATAELLAWIHILDQKIDPKKNLEEQVDAFQESYAVLAKTSEDLKRLRDRAESNLSQNKLNQPPQL